jgi:hypothetical protein
MIKKNPCDDPKLKINNFVYKYRKDKKYNEFI